MAIRIAVPKERTAGERRVALVPETVARLCKQGCEVLVESGAGADSFFSDSAYVQAGARIVGGEELYQAEVVFKVQPPLPEEVHHYRRGQVLIGFLNVHRNAAVITGLRDAGVTSFGIERIPRIRAQAMDALSSQATVAGYRAVLMAADLPCFFPMLTTAAGTIRPARALILAPVWPACRRSPLPGAWAPWSKPMTRRAAREQVESLGAKFLQVEMNAEAEGGYARELTAEEKEREQVLLRKSIASRTWSSPLPRSRAVRHRGSSPKRWSAT